jgi:hypothetical protein
MLHDMLHGSYLIVCGYAATVIGDHSERGFIACCKLGETALLVACSA